MRKIENPVITDKGSGRTTETHPSYGLVTVHRGQGHVNLFGSDFTHQHCITVEVKTAELDRDISHDWPHQRKNVVSFTMSEAQWAAFVGRVGDGNGTQCTFNTIGGEMIPLLPDPADRTKQFSNEVKGKLESSLKELNHAIHKVKEMKISQKAKDELIKNLEMAKQHINSNVPYVLKQFEEHMDNNIEKAKSEVHGYIQNTISRTGLEILRGQSPLVIESKAGK